MAIFFWSHWRRKSPRQRITSFPPLSLSLSLSHPFNSFEWKMRQKIFEQVCVIGISSSKSRKMMMLFDLHFFALHTFILSVLLSPHQINSQVSCKREREREMETKEEMKLFFDEGSLFSSATRKNCQMSIKVV